MIGFAISMFFIGIVAGFVARALVPGRDPLSFMQTVLLGVVGSFVGGLIGSFFATGDGLQIRPSGVFGSIVGSIVALLVYRRVTKKTHSRV